MSKTHRCGLGPTRPIIGSFFQSLEVLLLKFPPPSTTKSSEQHCASNCLSLCAPIFSSCHGGSHRMMQDKTKQNKTKQNKTKQNKTKQSKAKQSKAKKSTTAKISGSRWALISVVAATVLQVCNCNCNFGSARSSFRCQTKMWTVVSELENETLPNHQGNMEPDSLHFSNTAGFFF